VVGEPPPGWGGGREHAENTAILMRHAALYRSHVALGVQLLSEGALAPRDRELAILRTGWLCQAPFEWGEHVLIGKRAGLTEAEVERVTLGSAAPDWDEPDRAILRATEELHQDSMISDAVWEVLARRLDAKQLIELPILVGHYHAVAYYQNALRLRPRVGNLGLAAR
jgi:alkylhydroperoxidase family enzyme